SRLDHYWSRNRQGFLGLKTVSGDRKNGQIVRCKSALLDQLPGDRDGHSSGGLGEYPFGLCQQLDAVSDLIVAHVLGPATGFGDDAGGVITVGWIADGKGLGNRVGLDRPNIGRTTFHGVGDGVASACLSSENSGRSLAIKKSKSIELRQCLVNLADQ